MRQNILMNLGKNVIKNVQKMNQNLILIQIYAGQIALLRDLSKSLRQKYACLIALLCKDFIKYVLLIIVEIKQKKFKM